MSLKISVALATYQGARHLLEQLQSIAAQTLLPTELVVSDDGSTDATLTLVQEFARVAPFSVKVLTKSQRLGFSDNFLFAAENCSHELIAFCDQDDVWLPNKLQTAHDRLLHDGSLLALHRLVITDGQLQPSGVIWTQDIKDNDVYHALQLDPYINGWGNSMLFRRELLQLVSRTRRPRQPERSGLPLSHDTWIYVLAAALGRVSHILPALVLYRQHDDNIYGVRAPRLREELLKRFTAPVHRLSEQAAFNDTMVAIFTEISASCGSFAEASKRAAARFTERRDFLRARARIYTEPSVSARLAAFGEAHRLMADTPPRARTRAKELLVGVSGLDLLMRRLH